MLGCEGYPLIPVRIDKISKLAVFVDYEGVSPKALFDLLKNLQLSFDGSNQWFARGNSGSGTLELLFKPEWGNQTALVYQQYSKKRILPAGIYQAVERINAVRKTLTDRLAA